MAGLRPRQRAPSGTCPARSGGDQAAVIPRAMRDPLLRAELGEGFEPSKAGTLTVSRPPRPLRRGSSGSESAPADSCFARRRRWWGCDRDSGRLQGRAPPAGRGSSGRNPLPRIPASRGDSVVGATARAFRDCPARRAGIKRQESAPADSCFARRLGGGVATAKRAPSGTAPPAGRGSSGRNPLPRIPASRGNGAEKEGFEPSRQGFPHLTP